MKNLYCYIAQGTDPYFNLAAEKYLLDTLPENGVILYLWQNAQTVVIGSNQNAWSECRCALLQEEGGTLARRLSGGGAVYHDLGNLNFTFLCAEQDYDLEKQLSVIALACQKAGIAAERSGRNDLLAQGKKFSGNAFYHHQGKAYHHGTILIDADAEKMSRYLTPPKAKLQAKGVASVRARVVNLKELSPTLTPQKMMDLMQQAFGEIYQGTPQILPPVAEETLAPLAKEFADPSFLFGRSPQCDIGLEERFDWGQVDLRLTVQKGAVQTVAVYTDAMEHTLATDLQNALQNAPFTPEGIQAALAPLPYAEDLFTLLSRAL